MIKPLISRLRLLTDLAEDDLHAFGRACSSKLQFEAGTDLTSESKLPSCLHVLIDGWAARYAGLSRGRRQIPAIHLPGDICDLDGFTLEQMHFGLCALTTCTVAVLPHDTLRTLLDERPTIGRALSRLLAIENAISREWSVGLGRRSAEERAAHLLCELLVRLGAVNLVQDNSFLLPIFQWDLADMLGLSTVHVNRMLMELRARGLISLKRHQLTVLDPEALRQFAGFDAHYLCPQRRSAPKDVLGLNAEQQARSRAT